MARVWVWSTVARGPLKARLTSSDMAETPDTLRAAEFFAGIGMVRLGLERSGIDVVWSNDWEPAKAEMHATHFGDDDTVEYVVGDIGEVAATELPGALDLAWASFPCTNLSLAGNRAGLAGSESSTFFEWIRILQQLEHRPAAVAAENVVGLATSHGGDDLRAAIRSLNELGYSCDVVTLDARRFVPQSRPRLFVIGSLDPVQEAVEPNLALRPKWLDTFFADESLITHQAALPALPALRNDGFTDVAERLAPGDTRWWGEARSAAFIDSLSEIQRERVETLTKARKVTYRTAYRRTRGGVAVWEVRADDIAGCLRTARGGSSKQAVVRLGNGTVKIRWMTPSEYTTLMGAPDYDITGLRASQVMFGCGDAVVVDVVEWLGTNYLRPLIEGKFSDRITRLAEHPMQDHDGTLLSTQLVSELFELTHPVVVGAGLRGLTGEDRITLHTTPIAMIL